MDPTKRPSTVQVHDALLSRFRSLPASMEELPHADIVRTAPTPGARSEKSIFGVANGRIDELAEVNQLVISPSNPDHPSTLGTRGRGFAAEGEKFIRASVVVL